MDAALKEMTENALRVKRENEQVRGLLKEAKHLLQACNPADKVDVALKIKLLNELLNPGVR